MRILILSLLAASIVTPVFAQGANPSAADIIRQLTPTGEVGKTTRGSRPVVQQDATPVVPAKATKVMTPSGGAPAVNLTVNFASGSAEITPEAMQALDSLGSALSSDSLSKYRFRIEGHTDTVGSPAANRALSERRAEAVSQYLESKFGVSADRLQAVGMGSDQPAVATAAQVPEARNRRVQVVNLGG